MSPTRPKIRPMDEWRVFLDGQIINHRTILVSSCPYSTLSYNPRRPALWLCPQNRVQGSPQQHIMGAEIVAGAPPPLSLKCRSGSVEDNPSAKFSLIRPLIRLITGKLMPIPQIFLHLSGGSSGSYWSHCCLLSDQVWPGVACNQGVFLAHSPI